MKRTRITWILTSGVDFLRVKHDLKYLVLIGTDELNKRASLDDDTDPHGSRPQDDSSVDVDGDCFARRANSYALLPFGF